MSMMKSGVIKSKAPADDLISEVDEAQEIPKSKVSKRTMTSKQLQDDILEFVNNDVDKVNDEDEEDKHSEEEEEIIHTEEEEEILQS